MTLEEADSLAKHADTFTKETVRSILGELNTPKVQKAVRHVLGAIQMHGHLRNANKSSNEARHKVEKLYYRRSNKILTTSPAQIARQSQGTQAVLERLDNEDSATIRADKLRRRRRSLARGGKFTAATGRPRPAGAPHVFSPEEEDVIATYMAAWTKGGDLLTCELAAIILRPYIADLRRDEESERRFGDGGFPSRSFFSLFFEEAPAAPSGEARGD